MLVMLLDENARFRCLYGDDIMEHSSMEIKYIKRVKDDTALFQ